MVGDSQVRSDCLQLYLYIQAPCFRRVVSLKIRTMDASTRELNGPGLARGLRELVAGKDLGERVQVWETSCMRGCLVSPRLNVVGAGGFKDTVRSLYLPTTRRTLRCFLWQEVTSVEAFIDQYSRA